MLSAKNNNYYTRFDHYQHDLKNTWNMINKILNRSESKQFLDYVESANSRVADKHFIVNVFNDFFSHIGTKMASSSTISTTENNAFSEYLSGNINNVFKFTPVTVEQVKTYISQLNSKSSFLDGLRKSEGPVRVRGSQCPARVCGSRRGKFRIRGNLRGKSGSEEVRGSSQGLRESEGPVRI